MVSELDRAENTDRITSDDDPERCQGVGPMGQCRLKRVPGSNFCAMHGGAGVRAKQQRDANRQYRLTKFRARLSEFADDNSIKSLREEIGILRILIEERFNSCTDTHDLILQSGPISDLVMRVDKVVSSCHRIEQATGALLDKTAVLQFGNELVQLLGEELESSPEVLTRISERIYDLIARTLEIKDAPTETEVT